MQDEKIIKQNSPKNILWKVFRISVEDVIIPKEIEDRNREFLERIQWGK